MRKILYLSAVIIAVAFSCSKDDSNSTQTTPKAVCHFDDFRRANGNPQITYGIKIIKTKFQCVHL